MGDKKRPKNKKAQWHSIPGKIGIRYREHPTRKWNRSADRYYVIRYRFTQDGESVRHEEGVGWASEGYTAKRVANLRAQILAKIDELGRAYSLAELRTANELDIRERALQTVREEQQAATFDYACDRYLEWAQVHKKSWKNDRGHITRHLKPFLGRQLLTDITPNVVESFRTHLKSKRGRLGRILSESTIAECCQLVSKIFRVARLIHFRPDTPEVPLWTGPNPCTGLRITKPKNNARWRVLTDDQIKNILASALNLELLGVRKRYMTINHAMVFHDAILFALSTGARLAEVCNLKWSFVDLERNAIRLTETKNTFDRTVFADEACMDMLKRRSVRDSNESHVFWDANRSIRPARLTKAFTRIVKHLKLNEGFTRDMDKIVFHTLRHTYGTRQIIAGTSILALKKLMGHRQLSTTENYVHMAEDFMRAEALRQR